MFTDNIHFKRNKKKLVTANSFNQKGGNSKFACRNIDNSRVTGSEYCLTQTEQFFSYIMGRTSYFLTRWCWCKLYIRPTWFTLGF